jgi:biopolymer transport protein ExbD
MSGGAMPSPGGGGGRKGITAGRGPGNAEAMDLDMTPMMNMLIILISFLVTMVVFTQLAVIKFSLPSSSEGAEGGAPADSAKAAQDVDITLVISESGFQIVGDGRKLDPIPKGPKGYDFPKLGDSMKRLRDEFPAAQSVVMLIDTSILYQDIVSAMDVCRERKFPNILLSGGVYQ